MVSIFYGHRKNDLLSARRHLIVNGWKKQFQANGYKNQAGIIILINHKTDNKPKPIRRDKWLVGTKVDAKNKMEFL